MKIMACSGVWIEHSIDDSIKIGVTDYYVSEFGDSDWEWSVHLNKKEADKLSKALQKEFNKDLSLKEMIASKFGNNLDTIGFVKYLNDLKLKYIVDRSC